MSIEEYRNKRDFQTSPEPKGVMVGITSTGGDNKKGDNVIFVIHEHHATHLHWDLRLQIKGVLKSWAVPKNPEDVNKGTKRLAIHVEDHPLEYGEFEGTIPEGMYGAGTVTIWDKGKLKIEEETDSKITFELKGKKMNGFYTLLYVPKMGKNSWLFMIRKSEK